MRRIFCLALLALLPLLPARAEEGKAIDLFDGKTLEGWRVWVKDSKSTDTAFKVEDGIIKCSGKPFGYIITQKEYGDYKLEVEWRWEEGAKKIKNPNSGVLLHVSGPDMTWPKSAEAQLWSGHAGDFWLIGGFKLDVDKERQDKKTPRHYFKMKTDKPAEKPMGEWNKYEIVCKGDTITLSVNGVKLNEGKGAELAKGKIALQSEGAPISFRNIKLTPLK